MLYTLLMSKKVTFLICLKFTDGHWNVWPICSDLWWVTRLCFWVSWYSHSEHWKFWPMWIDLCFYVFFLICLIFTHWTLKLFAFMSILPIAIDGWCFSWWCKSNFLTFSKRFWINHNVINSELFHFSYLNENCNSLIQSVWVKYVGTSIQLNNSNVIIARLVRYDRKRSQNSG
jgi:hypothetical protein